VIDLAMDLRRWNASVHVRRTVSSLGSFPTRVVTWGLWIGVAIVTGVFHGDVVAAGEVRVGVAREELILPKAVPLAGYSRRGGKPSRGVHDPVSVRALVMQDGSTSAALVSCDLLIIDEHLFDAVRQQLITRGVSKGLTLILAATHTHSGPGGYGTKFFEKLSMGHFDPAIFEAIVSGVTQAIIRAQAQSVPVRVAYATATTEGLIVNRMDRAGVVNPELVISAFYPLTDESPLAVLINFAAHPTTLGAWNRQLSADYPGVAVREVERQFPTTTCLFFAGAVGDQAPTKHGPGFESANRIGHTLAQQVVARLKDAHPDRVDSLKALQEQLSLPPAQIRVGPVTLPRWLGARLADDDATLSVVAVGRLLFIGVPCDLTAEFGAVLERSARTRGAQPMIIGFASDYIGYCVPEALYRSKRYESSMAFNGPRAGALIVERLIRMVDEVVTRPK